MDLIDLLADPVLHLVLHTPTSTMRLARPVSWCAPTELLDPSAYLTAHALVLTAGMGLNFQDLRTWDAYVERLARVPVSGVVLSTGDAHAVVPSGLVEAASSYDIPVLELMADVPTLLLMRHVESALATERFREAQRAWELADSCARLATDGMGVQALLNHLENAAVGPIALVDHEGAILFSSHQWQNEPDFNATTRRLPLPGDLAERCFLVVPAATGRDIAGPAAAVIAMHIAYSLSGKDEPSEAQSFLDALLAPDAESRAAHDALARASLQRTCPTLALCFDLEDDDGDVGESGVLSQGPGKIVS